jgi:hypothetical protein
MKSEYDIRRIEIVRIRLSNPFMSAASASGAAARFQIPPTSLLRS